MTHRQIGEDKVGSDLRAVQIRSPGDGHTGQDGDSLWSGAAPVSDGTGRLQAGVEEEIGIVTAAGDVSRAVDGFIRLAIEDVQSDDGWRVDRTTVGGSCLVSSVHIRPVLHTLLAGTAGSRPFGALDNLESVDNFPLGLRDPLGRADHIFLGCGIERARLHGGLNVGSHCVNES